MLRAQAGARDEAIGLYRHAINAGATFASAHFNLSLLLQEAGDAAEGASEIAKAVQLDPSLASRVPKAP